jgi:hypothetical protein
VFYVFRIAGTVTKCTFVQLRPYVFLVFKRWVPTWCFAHNTSHYDVHWLCIGRVDLHFGRQLDEFGKLNVLIVTEHFKDQFIKADFIVPIIREEINVHRRC